MSNYRGFDLGLKVDLSTAAIASGDWVQIETINRDARLLIRVTSVEDTEAGLRYIKGAIIRTTGNTALSATDPIELTLDQKLPQQGFLLKRSTGDFSTMAADEQRTLMAVELRELLIASPRGSISTSAYAKHLETLGLMPIDLSWPSKKARMYRVVDNNPTLFTRAGSWIKLIDDPGMGAHKIIAPTDFKTPTVVDFPKFVEGAKLLLEAFGFVVRA